MYILVGSENVHISKSEKRRMSGVSVEMQVCSRVTEYRCVGCENAHNGSITKFTHKHVSVVLSIWRVCRNSDAQGVRIYIYSTTRYNTQDFLTPYAHLRRPTICCCAVADSVKFVRVWI